MKKGRGLGYKPDEADARDFSAKGLLGAVRGLPPEASLEEHVRRIKDQQWTSSCVGQAIATAADTRLRKLNIAAPEPSSLAVYTAARSLARFDKNEPLSDFGSFPRLAMKGIRDFGVPAESVWPFDPSKVDSELPWDAHQAASAFRIINWYRIDSVGQGRIEDVKNAIAKGFPVVFGTAVDQAFQDHTGKAPVGPKSGASLGGHMMCLVGYRNELFRGVNSWGTGWGDGGLYWANEAFVASPDATDWYVLVVSGG
jgi:C1A family cysteine protease